MSSAGTSAVNWEPETNLVASSVRSKNTVALLLKLAPLTKSVRAGPPRTVVTGDIDVMTVAGEITSNVAAFDCLPSPLLTTTLRSPGVAVKVTGTVAFRSREVMNVVATGAPSTNTVAPESKFIPETNSGNAGLPAITNAGTRLCRTGGGGITVNVTEF